MKKNLSWLVAGLGIAILVSGPQAQAQKGNNGGKPPLPAAPQLKIGQPEGNGSGNSNTGTGQAGGSGAGSTVRLCDGTPLTCGGATSGGSGIIVSGLPTFRFSTNNTVSGEAMVAILVPAGQAASFTVTGFGGGAATVTSFGLWSGSPNTLSGKTGGFLGLGDATGSGTKGGFNPLQGVTGLVLSGFSGNYDVFVADLGTYSCSKSGSCPEMTWSISGTVPAGTTLWGFVEGTGSACGKASSPCILASTPYSETAVTTGNIVPEPGSLALFGTGVVVFGSFLRRRKTAA